MYIYILNIYIYTEYIYIYYVYSNHKIQYSYSSVVLDNIHHLGSCSQIKFSIAKKNVSESIPLMGY